MFRTRTTALITTLVAAASISATLSVAILHAQATKPVALVGGMLLTGYEIPPIHHAAIVIEGNKIIAGRTGVGDQDPRRCYDRRHQRPRHAAGADRNARPPDRAWPRQLRHLVPVDQQPRRRCHADTRDGNLGPPAADGGRHDDGRSRRAAEADPHHPRSHQHGRGGRIAHARERAVDRASVGRRGQRGDAGRLRRPQHRDAAGGGAGNGTAGHRGCRRDQGARRPHAR